MRWVLPRRHRVHLVDGEETIPYGPDNLRWMSPDEVFYLIAHFAIRSGMFEHYHIRQEPSYDRVLGRLSRGLPVDPPLVETVNGKEVRGDGEHRAVAAYDLGFEKMPVVVQEVEE